MIEIRFRVDTDVPSDRVIAAATDFSTHRPELWPDLDPRVYRVLGVGPGRAEAMEGSGVLGGIWAREKYTWSADTVRAEVQESNVFRRGSTWELRATPRQGGGAALEWVSRRYVKGLKGHLLGLMLAAGRTRGPVEVPPPDPGHPGGAVRARDRSLRPGAGMRPTPIESPGSSGSTR